MSMGGAVLVVISEYGGGAVLVVISAYGGRGGGY